MSHLKGAKIKHYRTLISKTKLEREQLKEEYKILQSKIDKNANHLKKFHEEMQKLSQDLDTVVLSEHALIRYLQRVYKLDLEKIEQEIITPELINSVAEFGNGTYTSDGAYSVKVVDGVIVTILDNDSTHKKSTMKKKPSVTPTIEQELEALYEEKNVL